VVVPDDDPAPPPSDPLPRSMTTFSAEPELATEPVPEAEPAPIPSVPF
jgi:hypothetical protein